MGFCSNALSCVFHFFNTIYGISAVCMLVMITFLIPVAPTSVLVFLYIIAGVGLLVSVIGCCGVCNEDACLTTTYAIAALLHFISQLTNKFWVSSGKTFENFVVKEVKDKWLEEIRKPGTMDKVQQIYECCGQYGPQDYAVIHRSSPPYSCYPDNTVNATAIYHKGCIAAAEEKVRFLTGHSDGLEWFGLAITVIMCLIAFYLAVRFRGKYRRYNY